MAGLAVARLGDLGSHACFGSHALISSNSTVYVNGILVCTVGDQLHAHTCGDETHSGNVVSGSPTIYVEGKPVARITSSVSCGSSIITGSTDTFVD